MTSQAAPSSAATLALLWERVRKQGDMPGFARAIGAILGAMRGEQESEFCMTQTVLSDPVLTQKVLRLANSGMYAAFGQRISTVSKAVLVLGPDAIGHLALGLKLVEELQAPAHGASNAHAEMEKAVLAGMVAQQVAGNAEGRDSEEAVVCAMLHALGRMAVTFYLPELWNALQQAAGPGSEDAAALALLGVSLEDVGRATAERWGLPHTLIASMRSIEPAPRPEAFSDADWLAALSTMSTRCADSLWKDDAEGDDNLQSLADGFAPMLGVQAGSVMDAIGKAREHAIADLSVAPFVRAAQTRAGSLGQAGERARDDKLLVCGLAEMRSARASAAPDLMLSMGLETLYQGLGFERALAFLFNARDKTYAPKIGFGPGVRALMPKMRLGERDRPNVFHTAITHDRVVFIENTRDPDFAPRLPAWWKASLMQARSFVIVPLCHAGQPLGFLYGDWNDEKYQMPLNQTQFAQLNELRALVVECMERKLAVT